MDFDKIFLSDMDTVSSLRLIPPLLYVCILPMQAI